MDKRNWVILILILIIIVIVVIVVCFSNYNVKASIEHFIDDVTKQGIASLVDEYGIDKKNNGVKNRKEVTVSDNNVEETINIEVPEIPQAFLRDTRAVSIDFESSGIKRTKPERLCKKVLEKIYRKKFSRVRPSWLKNPLTNRNLELDCYNDDLKLGLEFNGPHHYLFPNWTGMSKEEFLRQVERDKFKLDACDANGVYLIVVPYNIPNHTIPDFIEYMLPHNVQRRREMQLSSS